MLKPALLGIVALAGLLASAPLYAQDTPNDEALVRLTAHLEKIRGEYAFNRVLGGGSLVGTGLLVGAGGTAVISSDALSLDPPTKSMATGLVWAYSGIFILPGVLVLVLKSDYETLPEKFARAPDDTEHAQNLKVAQGEVTLKSLSDKARFERLMTAGLFGIGGGALLLSRFSGDSTASGPSTAYSGDSALYTGLLYLGAAVLRMALQSTPENEQDSYDAWLHPRR